MTESSSHISCCVLLTFSYNENMIKVKATESGAEKIFTSRTQLLKYICSEIQRGNLKSSAYPISPVTKKSKLEF